jgi:hypothetical protein
MLSTVHDPASDRNSNCDLDHNQSRPGFQHSGQGGLTPTKQGNPCARCGDTSGKCRETTAGAIILCMVEASDGNGYRSTGQSSCGAWTKFYPERADRPDEGPDDSTPQGVEARDRHYRSILASLRLDREDWDDLRLRGLTDDQIDRLSFRSVSKFQKLGDRYPTGLPGVLPGGRCLNVGDPGYLIPVRNADGLIVAMQTRLRNVVVGGRYRWLTSKTKKNPDGATPHIDGELPLACHGFDLNGPHVGIAEGTGVKPTLVSLRLGIPVIGAAGAQWAGSPTTLTHSLNVAAKRAGSKTVVFYPDSGATVNDSTLRQYKRAAAFFTRLGYEVRFAWWGQVEKQSGNDADEIPIETLKNAELLTWKQFSTIKAGAAPATPGGAAPAETGSKRSAADQLLDQVDAADVELFSTSDGTAYADIRDGATRQTLGLRKREFKDWLTNQYYSATKKSASADAITQAISTLEAKARFQGEKRAVFIRSAALDGAVYLDLGDDSWGVVEISATGWQLVYDAPVRFRRPSGQLPLPTPIAGGDLDALQSLLNLDQDNWVIVLLWLLQSLKPAAEYPILVVTAPPRTGKSTFSEALKNLIDPSTVSMLPSVGDPRNFAVTGSNRRIIAIDNLSNLTPDQSDILCRASTGGGYSHRTLHSDGDETTIAFLNALILNSIDGVVSRGDLLDRSLPVTLRPPTERQSRSQFNAKLAAIHPAILGALLSLLSDVLRVLPEVQGLAGQSSERFTDLVEIGLAAEKALDWPIGTVDRVLKTARSEAHEIAVDSSPVGAAIRELMANPPDRAEWRGTAAQLLTTLSQIVPEKVSRGQYWPADSTRLAKILSRIGSDLEAIGIPIKRQKSNGTIFLSLTKTIDATPPAPIPPEPVAVELEEEIQWS